MYSCLRKSQDMFIRIKKHPKTFLMRLCEFANIRPNACLVQAYADYRKVIEPGHMHRSGLNTIREPRKHATSKFWKQRKQDVTAGLLHPPEKMYHNPPQVFASRSVCMLKILNMIIIYNYKLCSYYTQIKSLINSAVTGAGNVAILNSLFGKILTDKGVVFANRDFWPARNMSAYLKLSEFLVSCFICSCKSNTYELKCAQDISLGDELFDSDSFFTFDQLARRIRYVCETDPVLLNLPLERFDPEVYEVESKKFVYLKNILRNAFRNTYGHKTI